MFPSPYDCNQFYVCDHGYDHLFNCPADLYYDPKVKECNWPHLVDCNVNATGEPLTITLEQTEAAETTTRRKFDCQKSGDGMFPSPYDCNQFYVCDHGYDHLFNCPADLYYDPKVKECNYQKFVNCDL